MLFEKGSYRSFQLTNQSYGNGADSTKLGDAGAHT
jgi:hypothetical protein